MSTPSHLSSCNDPLESHTQHPKLKRFAAKPLKLAQSTLRPLTSRTSFSGSSSIASSSTTFPTDSGGSNSYRQNTGRRKIRRHHRLKGQAGLTPEEIANAAQGLRKPLEGEEPVAWLRVRVVMAEGLVAKDGRGTSDP